MKQLAAVHSTFVLDRAYPQPVSRAFAAFALPARKRRWLVDSDDHAVERYECDFRVGGAERFALRYGDNTPIAGALISSEGFHLDIVDERRIVIASTMSMNGACFSASLVTVEFLADGGGTRLLLTHQGAFFEGADGPEMREHGWRTLLDRLAVELAR